MCVVSAAGDEGDWRLRYSAVQAVACVCQGVEPRGGLRTVAWLALQEQLSHTPDESVRTAMTLMEVQEDQN